MKWTIRGVLGCVVAAASCGGAWAGDGSVALQTADPSCGSGSAAIYVDCGNGTVTDTRSGLVWLADADCLGIAVDWYTAAEFAAGLSDLPEESAASAHDCGLSDGSSPGEWRLPSKAEWAAMIGDALAHECDPTLTSDNALVPQCWSAGCHGVGACAFFNVAPVRYWTSTNYPGIDGGHHIYAGTLDGALQSGPGAMPDFAELHKSTGAQVHVWPVRGGQ